MRKNLTKKQYRYSDLKDLLLDIEQVRIPAKKDSIKWCNNLINKAKTEWDKENFKSNLFVDKIALKALFKQKKMIEEEMKVLSTEIEAEEKKREARRAYMNNWRSKNFREDNKQYYKTYYQRNLQKVRDYQTKYYQEHREAISAANKIRYKEKKKQKEDSK